MVNEPISTTQSWGLRTAGLSMGESPNTVREFNGLWGLKEDADISLISAALAEPWFLPTTAKLALIRTARWFVIKTGYFPGYTLVFVTQFDGSLEKYFDDFTLNGKENLFKVWGQCTGCPEGPDSTARGIVQFIARGQFRTLAVYDAFPEISYNQVAKMSDVYEKTRTFQRDVSKPEGTLESKVQHYLEELTQVGSGLQNAATIDPCIKESAQYEDIAEHIAAS